MTHASPPFLIGTYRFASRLAMPLAMPALNRRIRRGKEDPERLNERLGRPLMVRPSGRLVWFHAASVGETNTVLPLIKRILDEHPQCTALLTTTTVTSARLAAERLPPRTIHQFAPIDLAGPANRFMRHWRPDLAVFTESELWPNLLIEARRSGARLVLVNGRMSQRSFSRWQSLPKAIGYLLGTFDMCLAQSDMDARRLEALGAHAVIRTGNLKFDAPPPPAPPIETKTFGLRVRNRPCWVAASTHAGEEEIVADAHSKIGGRFPNLLTIIAPRHPDRGDEIESMLTDRGFKVARRSRAGTPGPDTQIFLLDTIGELGLVYSNAKIAFMGGSLIRHGGQNPIEPARLGAAILHGPHVGNFSEIYNALDAAGGAEAVSGYLQLAQAVERFIENPRKLEMRADAARAALAPFDGALDRTMAALRPLVALLDEAA